MGDWTRMVLEVGGEDGGDGADTTRITLCWALPVCFSFAGSCCWDAGPDGFPLLAPEPMIGEALELNQE